MQVETNYIYSMIQTQRQIQPNLNTSYNPFIIEGNTTMNSSLNILGNIFAANLPNASTFNIIMTISVTINSGQYIYIYIYITLF